MKIVVLAGGLSPERDVSLSSGSLIANALLNKGYEVMLLDLYLGTNNKDIEPKYYKDHTFNYKVEETEPDLNLLKEEYGSNEIGEGVIDICKDADIVFLALHGGIGENGTIQEIFDREEINYTGSSSISCKNSMNKKISKSLVKDIVSVANTYTLENVLFPCIVKPTNGGSSVGTSIVNDEEEFKKAFNLAKKYEEDILIEEFIPGREFSVGILDGKALPSIEIIPKKGFYDYENKYQEGATIEICPSDIPDFLEKELRNYALKCHKALGLGFYSRIDFIVDKNNKIYFLEANSLPGMTPTSLLPQEAKQIGINYDDLCEMIIFSKINKQ